MISGQIIQNSIEELKNITRVDICIYDLRGTVVASTVDHMDIPADIIMDFAASPADSQVIRAHHLLKITDDGEVIYVCVARGTGDDAYMIGKIAVSQIQNLSAAYKEKYDRNSFFQNLILDNMLLVDILNKAKKLHIEPVVPRAVFIIETSSESGTVSDLLKGMYSTQAGDYVTIVEEDNLILIKALEDDRSPEALERIASTIVDMVNAEAMLNVRVAYGTVVDELKDVSKSYKEAEMALQVGKIFYTERNIAAYSALGIGRLIYQLPVNLCRLFIDEVFGGELPAELDDETVNTINKFFEYNLNISETSRQLFIHRNTLVYRLDRIDKAIGLDVRSFDDALTFKIAMMVVNYIKYLENQNL